MPQRGHARFSNVEHDEKYHVEYLETNRDTAIEIYQERLGHYTKAGSKLDKLVRELRRYTHSIKHNHSKKVSNNRLRRLTNLISIEMDKFQCMEDIVGLYEEAKKAKGGRVQRTIGDGKYVITVDFVWSGATVTVIPVGCPEAVIYTAGISDRHFKQNKYLDTVYESVETILARGSIMPYLK